MTNALPLPNRPCLWNIGRSGGAPLFNQEEQ